MLAFDTDTDTWTGTIHDALGRCFRCFGERGEMARVVFRGLAGRRADGRFVFEFVFPRV